MVNATYHVSNNVDTSSSTVGDAIMFVLGRSSSSCLASASAVGREGEKVLVVVDDCLFVNAFSCTQRHLPLHVDDNSSIHKSPFLTV